MFQPLLSVLILPGIFAGCLSLPAFLQQTPAAVPAVTDLAVWAVDGTSVTLSFTEVADSLGSPADYVVSFQQAPFSPTTAARVTFGSCAGRIIGSSAGSERRCSVENLTGGNTYEFQVMAFAGKLPAPAVAESYSNIVAATPGTGGVASTVVSAADELITRHTFTETLEDDWHFRNHAPAERNFEHGDTLGDGYGQANYPVTLRPGTGPIQLRRSWDAVDEITVTMRWQVSPNMEHRTGSQVKKIWFLEAPLTNPIFLALAANGRVALMTQRTAEQGDGAARMQGGHVTAGQIYDLKVYVKLNSVTAANSSNPDGIATVWLDGRRIMHRTNLRFRGEDSPQRPSGRYFGAHDGITGIRWNPTWPNGGDSPTEPMWERLYSIAVSRGPGG